MVAWPASLPQEPLYEGNQETLANNVQVTQMDVGPPKRRLRTTSGNTGHQYNFMMSVAQLATFRAFWEDDVKFGSIPFTLDHPSTGVSALEFTFAVEDGTPVIERRGPNSWFVSLNLKHNPV